MTAAHIVDPARLLDQALSRALPDIMRSLLQTMINALLSADAVRGTEWGRPSELLPLTAASPQPSPRLHRAQGTAPAARVPKPRRQYG